MADDIVYNWKRLRQAKRKAYSTGLITVERVGKRRMHVVSPFNEEFRRGMNELGARWKERAGCWSIQAVSWRLLAQLIAHCYGPESVPENLKLRRVSLAPQAQEEDTEP